MDFFTSQNQQMPPRPTPSPNSATVVTGKNADSIVKFLLILPPAGLMENM